MIRDFEEYEQILAIYLADGHEAYELGIFDEPEKPEGYDDYKMQKDADAYETHLQMYKAALLQHSEAQAKLTIGEPKKPETYDAYKLKQFKYYEYHLQCFNNAKDAYERNFIDEPEKPEGYDQYKKNIHTPI